MVGTHAFVPQNSPNISAYEIVPTEVPVRTVSFHVKKSWKKIIKRRQAALAESNNIVFQSCECNKRNDIQLKKDWWFVRLWRRLRKKDQLTEMNIDTQTQTTGSKDWLSQQSSLVQLLEDETINEFRIRYPIGSIKRRGNTVIYENNLLLDTSSMYLRNGRLDEESRTHSYYEESGKSNQRTYGRQYYRRTVLLQTIRLQKPAPKRVRYVKKKTHHKSFNLDLNTGLYSYDAFESFPEFDSFLARVKMRDTLPETLYNKLSPLDRMLVCRRIHIFYHKIFHIHTRDPDVHQYLSRNSFHINQYGIFSSEDSSEKSSDLMSEVFVRKPAYTLRIMKPMEKNPKSLKTLTTDVIKKDPNKLQKIVNSMKPVPEAKILSDIESENAIELETSGEISGSIASTSVVQSIRLRNELYDPKPEISYEEKTMVLESKDVYLAPLILKFKVRKEKLDECPCIDVDFDLESENVPELPIEKSDKSNKKRLRLSVNQTTKRKKISQSVNTTNDEKSKHSINSTKDSAHILKARSFGSDQFHSDQSKTISGINFKKLDGPIQIKSLQMAYGFPTRAENILITSTENIVSPYHGEADDTISNLSISTESLVSHNQEGIEETFSNVIPNDLPESIQLSLNQIVEQKTDESIGTQTAFTTESVQKIVDVEQLKRVENYMIKNDDEITNLNKYQEIGINVSERDLDSEISTEIVGSQNIDDGEKKYTIEMHSVLSIDKSNWETYWKMKTRGSLNNLVMIIEPESEDEPIEFETLNQMPEDNIFRLEDKFVDNVLKRRFIIWIQDDENDTESQEMNEMINEDNAFSTVLYSKPKVPKMASKTCKNARSRAFHCDVIRPEIESTQTNLVRIGKSSHNLSLETVNDIKANRRPTVKVEPKLESPKNPGILMNEDAKSIAIIKSVEMEEKIPHIEIYKPIASLSLLTESVNSSDGVYPILTPEDLNLKNSELQSKEFLKVKSETKVEGAVKDNEIGEARNESKTTKSEILSKDVIDAWVNADDISELKAEVIQNLDSNIPAVDKPNSSCNNNKNETEQMTARFTRNCFRYIKFPEYIEPYLDETDEVTNESKNLKEYGPLPQYLKVFTRSSDTIIPVFTEEESDILIDSPTVDSESSDARLSIFQLSDSSDA